jgi:hypothetical protein
VLQTIEFILKQTAIANGLSASSLSTEPSNESGIARIIGNIELMEQRADEIELFRGYEKRILKSSGRSGTITTLAGSSRKARPCESIFTTSRRRIR